MNFFSKIIFYLRKPKVIIVMGNGRACATEAVFQVLNQHFKVKKFQEKTPDILSILNNKILILEFSLKEKKNTKKLINLVKNSKQPILITTNTGDISLDKYFFEGNKEVINNIKEITESLPNDGFLILNSDDESARDLKTEALYRILTFGFQERSDLRATDINLNHGVNFKINYEGNIVPVWLERLFNKEQIYSVLAAALVGTIFNLNLIEISQALKFYQSVPGKMKLIEGVKQSWILDDSESASVHSMTEAIDILRKTSGFQRKIAVLGDIIGLGKDTIEIHEAIGEKLEKNADLVFIFGQRARFFVEGAKRKGMPLDKVFQFDNIKKGKIKLQEEIREGDLVLVSGSKEMNMKELVEEVKKI
ncbi:glutamate ligase domain-containing protein [Patescibacteria group bacterium]